MEQKHVEQSFFYNWLLDNKYLNDLLKEQLRSAKEMVEMIRRYDTWDWASMGEEGLVSKMERSVWYIFS